MSWGNAGYDDWLLLGKAKPGTSRSPFYSRIYAGYSAAQLRCIIQHIEETGGQLPIFDPMAGQAFALSTLSWFGHSVRINDINPAPLFLAWLRSAPVLKTIEERARSYRTWLKSNRRKIDGKHVEHKKHLPFITEWLSDSMKEQLRIYGILACEGHPPKPFLELSDWNEDILFRLAMIVLAARRVTCHLLSDNRTWLKPGGLDNKPRLTDAILSELDVLIDCPLAEAYRMKVGLFDRHIAGLQISCSDIAHTEMSAFEERCIAVTSPPYANRLDYSVMWGPELWVLSTALPSIDRDAIKRDQIGTTTIRRTNELENSIDRLPAQAQHELQLIEKCNAYATKHYYYPFFRQFALDLFDGLHHSVRAAPNSDKWLIFIRDTARKDIMFSSHAICEEVMKSCGYERRKSDDLQVIRSHIGVMRRAKTQSSIHGLAQREWWLVFDRER